MKHYLIILLLSIVAFFSHGYQFGVSDQEIFIPYILKFTDPALFKGDILFDQHSASSSFFYPFMGFLAKYVDIELLFFLGFILFQFIFFIATYQLSKTLLSSKNLAYLSLLPFFLPKFIGGTSTLTYDIFFGYRSIGLIFLIFYLKYLFEKKFVKSAFIAPIGMWFHPLSIIPSLFLLPILAIKSKVKPEVIFKSILLFIVLIMPLIFLSNLDFVSQLSYFKDNNWLSIIKFRDDYLFISSWSWRGWAALGMYLIIFILLGNKLRSKIRNIASIIVLVSFAVFVLNSLVLEVFEIPIIAQFQLVRSISPLAYIALAISPLLLTFKNIYLKVVGGILFFALSLNLFNVVLVSAAIFLALILVNRNYSLEKISTKIIIGIFIIFVIIHFTMNFNRLLNFRNRVQFPKQTNDWIDVQIWARENTRKDSVFLVSPNQTGFRIFSERSIIGDIKDGAVTMYDRNYALQWQERIHNLQDVQELDENEMKQLQNTYEFDYMVLPIDNKLNLKHIYENKNFKIYKNNIGDF